MDRQTYVDTVLSHAGYLTDREEKALRAELTDHMEDHMEGLLELGWDEPLAEERTLAAMGDPEEIGRRLRAEYPLRWVLLADLGRAAAAVLLLALLLARVLEFSWDIPGYLRQRLDPEGTPTLAAVTTGRELEDRLILGNDVLRLNILWLGEEGGVPMAELHADAFDRIPFGVVGLMDLTVENQAGEAAAGWITDAEVRRDDGRLDRYLARIPVAKGDDHITLCVRQFGKTATVEIPLYWEVSP